MAFLRYRVKKVDKTHNPIITLLRSRGAFVMDTHELGDDFPDAIALHNKQWYFIEIKDGARPLCERKPSKGQHDLHAEVERRGGKIHVVETGKQALALIGELE